MKQHYRLKLPSIEDGNLISKFARQDGHDIYNSVTIEEEWTEQSTSGENSGSDDANTSFSLRRCRRKNAHTLKGIASAILAQRCWAKEVRRKWETELKEVSNTKEQDKLSITFNAKGEYNFVLISTKQVNIPPIETPPPPPVRRVRAVSTTYVTTNSIRCICSTIFSLNPIAFIDRQWHS